MRFSSILIVSMLLIISCDTPVQEANESNKYNYKNSFVRTNQYIRERHRQQIMAFCERVGWNMTETPTGLWYMIEEAGDGRQIERDLHVTYSYETRLLDGTICYSSDTNEPKKIVVGKGNIEAGLEEGLLLLREHSKARFLIPPHLAHGNFGDMDKIPGSAVILVEVEILDVRR